MEEKLKVFNILRQAKSLLTHTTQFKNNYNNFDIWRYPRDFFPIHSTECAASEGRYSALNAVSLQSAWDTRPEWVCSSPSLEASYVLGMVGGTIAFNDTVSTTLAIVHEKFDLAIALAESLGI